MGTFVDLLNINVSPCLCSVFFFFKRATVRKHDRERPTMKRSAKIAGSPTQQKCCGSSWITVWRRSFNLALQARFQHFLREVRDSYSCPPSLWVVFSHTHTSFHASFSIQICCRCHQKSTVDRVVARPQLNVRRREMPQVHHDSQFPSSNGTPDNNDDETQQCTEQATNHQWTMLVTRKSKPPDNHRQTERNTVEEII